MGALLNTTLPVFGAIFAGYLITRLGILPKESSDYFNRIVYYLSFPALLFVVVARTPADKIFYWPFVFAWTGGLAITFVLTALLSAVLYRDRLGTLGMRCMNTTCASTAFMGIPLVVAAFGKEAAVPAILATTILSIVIVSATVLLIEIDHKSRVGSATILRDIALSLAKNPLMIAVTAGAVVALSGLKLPSPVERFCDLVGAAAIPVSLLAIGLFISGQTVRENLGEIGVLSAVKLIVHPVVTWLLIAAFFPLDPLWRRSVILLAALPPATTCFVIAKRFDTYVGETSAMAVLCTVISLFTISVVLLLLP